MHLSINQLANIVNGESFIFDDGDQLIDFKVTTDSRKYFTPSETVFFAIKGSNWDGHSFIPDLIEQGLNCFVIEDKELVSEKANFILVNNSVSALQELAKYHREQFNIPIIGITGSYGKTIVKDWFDVIAKDSFTICKSPKSYNSQIGVPLSLLHLDESNDLGVFEVGVSKKGEMAAHQHMLNCNIGLITNIGQAHASGFSSIEEKLDEKLTLFSKVDRLIYCSNYSLIEDSLRTRNLETISWGKRTEDTYRVNWQKYNGYSFITIDSDNQNIELEVTFTLDFELEDLLHTIVLALETGVSVKQIKTRVPLLEGTGRRMEVIQGLNNCTILSDFHSADISTLEIALDFQRSSDRSNYVAIISDLADFDEDDSKVKKAIGLIKTYHFDQIVLIGKHWKRYEQLIRESWPNAKVYEKTDQFLHSFNQLDYINSSILLKGRPNFGFKRIQQKLDTCYHDVCLEVNLSSVRHNLEYFRSKVASETKIMAMVKADSYGSGGVEIASYLESLNIDYLAVAYLDEGVQLRKAGVKAPIMVMNVNIDEHFPLLSDYQLEPEIHSIIQFESLVRILEDLNIVYPFPIHLKLETGMNRLGLQEDELSILIEELKNSKSIIVKSIFSHLIASDDLAKTGLSKVQKSRYDKMSLKILDAIDYKPIQHILNTSGIINLATYQMNMVRLGIGLYGYSLDHSTHLEPAISWKARVIQVKSLKKGDLVGYGGENAVIEDCNIAVINVGYADGFRRGLGNANTSVEVNGKSYPTIGNVCMDLFFVLLDSSDNVKEGDVAIIMQQDQLYTVSDTLNTIPYEILSGISSRVKRKYVFD